MSKLIDNLARLSRASGPSIGFKRSATAQSTGMLLAIEISGSDLSSAKEVVAVGIDALVIRIDSLLGQADALKDVAELVGNAAWGVHINKMGAEDATALRDLGCDFLIMNAPTAPAGVLSEKKLGKILRVDPQWGDGLIRSLDQVTLDALFLDTDESDTSGLSLHRLLVCQRLASISRKPLLVGVSQGLDSAGLQALHSIGVECIVDKYGEGASVEPLKELRKAIDALPAYRGRGRGMAILPRVEAATPVEAEEEEDGEEDE